jgi:hypothetical protein
MHLSAKLGLRDDACVVRKEILALCAVVSLTNPASASESEAHWSQFAKKHRKMADGAFPFLRATFYRAFVACGGVHQARALFAKA